MPAFGTLSGPEHADSATYGKIDHPAPGGVLAYYTMQHRVIMWWRLRHIGVLASANSESDLMQNLQNTHSIAGHR
ncbi:MAG TPA: hypothetical protein VF982_01210 [Anaerolineales bacterium]